MFSLEEKLREASTNTHTIRDKKKKPSDTECVNIFVRKILEQDLNIKPTTHYMEMAHLNVLKETD